MVQRSTQKAYLESGCWPNKKFKKLKFETKKGPVQTLSVLRKYWNEKAKSFYGLTFTFSKISAAEVTPERAAEIIPEQMLMDSRL